MTKSKFYKKLTTQFRRYHMSRRELKGFQDYLAVNEQPDKFLKPEQIRQKYEYRQKLVDHKELIEKYYVYHLLMTFYTKWAAIELDDIVNHYYKNSETIKKLRGKK